MHSLCVRSRVCAWRLAEEKSQAADVRRVRPCRILNQCKYTSRGATGERPKPTDQATGEERPKPEAAPNSPKTAPCAREASSHVTVHAAEATGARGTLWTCAPLPRRRKRTGGVLHVLYSNGGGRSNRRQVRRFRRRLAVRLRRKARSVEHTREHSTLALE